MNLTHTKHKEIPSLDGWRAVAITIVFLSHAGLGKIVPGGLGVTIFFFLSGYLITTLLLKEYADSGAINIRHFYIRRVLRLTPPLLLTLVIAYSLTYLGVFRGDASWTGFFAQLFYFANYYSLFFDPGHTIPTGTGVFWSLAVEEHFYFVFPALFLFLLHKADRKKLPFYLLLICVAVLLWRIYLVQSPSFSTNRTYYATDTRIDSILFGCILATLQLKDAWLLKLKQPAVRITAVSLGVVLLLLTLVVRSESFRETFRYSLQGIALMPLFFYSVNNPESFPFKILNLKLIRKIGIYSYSIYLSHELLLENADWASHFAILNILIALALSLVFAILVDRFIDTHLRKWRARFR